jgi:pimeloyl-ACP methyl ester carboxylesterase
MDELERRKLIVGKVGALGVSYGAAVAIQWAAIDRRVKAIVVMEPYCDFRDIAHDASYFVLGKWRRFFSSHDIDTAVNHAGKVGGFDPRDASPVRAIAQTSAPVLIIHSRSDQLIPWQHSQRLHNAAPMHSKLVLMTGPSHFNLWIKSKQIIREASLDWFQRYLKVGPEMAATE